MHHHEYYITMLKTPYGYLGYNGFVNDINDKDIILLPSNSYGIWSGNKRRVEFFLREFKGKYEDIKKINKSLNEVEIKAYACKRNGTACCYNSECSFKGSCDFWNKDRETLQIGKIYSL